MKTKNGGETKYEKKKKNDERERIKGIGVRWIGSLIEDEG